MTSLHTFRHGDTIDRRATVAVAPECGSEATGTAPKTATANTGVQTLMEIGSTAGQGADGYAVWREQVQWQRDGYAVAGVRSEVKTCGTVPVINGPAGGRWACLRLVRACGGLACGVAVTGGVLSAG